MGVEERLYEVTLYWMEDREQRSASRMQLGGNVLEAIARARTLLIRARPGIDVHKVEAELMQPLTAEAALEGFRKNKVM